MNTRFSRIEMLRTGWDLFKKHWKFILSLGVLTVFAQLFMEGMMQLSDRHNPVLGIILWVATTLVSIIITLGWSKVFLSLVRHGHADWSTFTTEPRMWLHLIKVEIWYAIYTLGCVLLALLPFGILAAVGFFTHTAWLQDGSIALAIAAGLVAAIYMRVRYQFISYAVLDYQGFRSRAVFRKSGTLVEGSFWPVFFFDILCALLEIVGILCILVGLIIVVPVIKIAQANVYDTLKKHKNAV